MTIKSILTASIAALALAATSLSSSDSLAGDGYGGYNINNLRSRAESAYTAISKAETTASAAAVSWSAAAPVTMTASATEQAAIRCAWAMMTTMMTIDREAVSC